MQYPSSSRAAAASFLSAIIPASSDKAVITTFAASMTAAPAPTAAGAGVGADGGGGAASVDEFKLSPYDPVDPMVILACS